MKYTLDARAPFKNLATFNIKSSLLLPSTGFEKTIRTLNNSQAKEIYYLQSWRSTKQTTTVIVLKLTGTLPKHVESFKIFF